MLHIDNHLLVHGQCRHIKHGVVQVICIIFDPVNFHLEFGDLVFEHFVLVLADFERLVQLCNLRVSLGERRFEFRAPIGNLLITLSQIVDGAVNRVARF